MEAWQVEYRNSQVNLSKFVLWSLFIMKFHRVLENENKNIYNNLINTK